MSTPLREPAGVHDLYTKMVTGEIGQPPQALTLGYCYTVITLEKVVAVFPANKNHHNPYGWVGGGSLSVVCDEAMGILCDVNLSDTELPKTIEYRIDFYRSVQESTLTITASFRKKGRSISHLESVVTDQLGQEIARATCTMLVTPCERKAEQ